MMTTGTLMTYVSAIQTWREEQEALLRAEDGWLTVVGLFWLREGENTLGSDTACDVVLPARFPARLGVMTLDGREICLRVTADDPPVLVEGESRREAVLRYGPPQTPTQVQIECVTLFVIPRGDRLAVRMRDAESEARRTFTGRQWFEVDPAFCVNARFFPHPGGRSLEVETAIGTSVRLSNPGAVSFEWAGGQHRLEAFEGDPDDELWFIFRDATSGQSTYGAGRFLYATLRADGSVDLDFNKAESPPCAFTPYATCPLPPKENVLPISITAGERE
ncbi:MAG: DUF1684 domain-containing protein [Chloroflexi bacterium]|nr:DUF1684 domain-containing protein [Chloroflexota bacterium]